MPISHIRGILLPFHNRCVIQHLQIATLSICFEFFLQVVVTERAGHAFDVMASLANKELNSYDGVIAVVSIRILSFTSLFACLFMLAVGNIRSWDFEVH